mmetsp:Transcript_58867/g.95153  ORF Transcript_58867/g.95153 Transcript_58867/m.95153 type:complete len:163 (-) Transcript_58867:77-565(-)
MVTTVLGIPGITIANAMMMRCAIINARPHSAAVAVAGTASVCQSSLRDRRVEMAPDEVLLSRIRSATLESVPTTATCASIAMAATVYVYRRNTFEAREFLTVGKTQWNQYLTWRELREQQDEYLTKQKPVDSELLSFSISTVSSLSHCVTPEILHTGLVSRV